MNKSINMPLNLPSSKETDYIISTKKGYDKICTLLYSLGCVCTFDQFKRIYKKNNPKISDSYLDKKTLRIITEMEKLKLIGIDNINTYKFLYLKKFAFVFATGDYTKYKKQSMSITLKDRNFKINLMKVEYYIKYNEIIKLDNLTNDLLTITNYIYNAKKKDNNLPYDLKLLNKIIKDKGIKNCYDEVDKLSENNLIRIVWININNIYINLRKQNQTIGAVPLYLKLYKKDSLLTLHYAPTIIIFDVFNISYYSKKISELYTKYFHIVSNHTRDMRRYYLENGTLGWEGYNHFGYNIKIIGYNNLELLEKKNYVDKFINENPNGILLTNCFIEYIDISKYFLHSSRKNDVFDNIDITFDKLLSEKLTILN